MFARLLHIVLLLTSTTTQSRLYGSPASIEGDRQVSPRFIDQSLIRRERSVDPKDLLTAIEQRDLSTVRDLVNDGVDVNYQSGAPLNTAAKLGDLEIAKVLLEAGALPDGPPGKARRGLAMLYAADENHIEMVSLLLEAGADINACTMTGGAIGGAIENGHLEMVQKLLDEGFNPNTSGGFPIIEAMQHNRTDMVTAFLDAGIDLNQKDGWICFTAGSNGNSEVVEAILDATNDTKHYGEILSGASAEGHLDIIQMMLDKGTDPNEGIYAAALNGQLAAAEMLFEAGAQIYNNTDQVEDPLHQLATSGNVDLIEMLVENGADINVRYQRDDFVDFYGDLGHHGNGWTPFHLAARWGHKNILQKMVDLGADVNAADTKGYTALHVAILNLKLDVVKELLKLCADWKLPNGKGETPHQLARKMVMRDFSQLQQQELKLKDFAMTRLKDRVIYYPYTEGYLKELAKDLQREIEENGTIVNELDMDFSFSDIQLATRKVFEDKAIHGLLDAIEEYGCKLSMGIASVAIGDRVILKCECLPRKARRLTVTHLPKGKKCSTPKDGSN